MRDLLHNKYTMYIQGRLGEHLYIDLSKMSSFYWEGFPRSEEKKEYYGLTIVVDTQSMNIYVNNKESIEIIEKYIEESSRFNH